MHGHCGAARFEIKLMGGKVYSGLCGERFEYFLYLHMQTLLSVSRLMGLTSNLVLTHGPDEKDLPGVHN